MNNLAIARLAKDICPAVMRDIVTRHTENCKAERLSKTTCPRAKDCLQLHALQRDSMWKMVSDARADNAEPSLADTYSVEIDMARIAPLADQIFRKTVL